jgi:hypothetical protein
LGIHGWTILDEKEPIKTLTGWAKDYFFSGPPGGVFGFFGMEGDGDWNINVQPAPESILLLRNPLNSKNGNNTNGMVECEVRPIPAIEPTPGSEDSSEVLHKYFKDIVNKEIPEAQRVSLIKVTGPWVADASHSWNGTECKDGCADEGKTEIHPILSIDATLPSPNPLVAKHKIFVFSDDSETFKPPFARQNYAARFRISFPDRSPTASSAAYRLESVDNLARSSVFSVVSDATGNHFLEGVVESGTRTEGHGFYQAVVYAGWLSRSLRESFQNRYDVSKGLRSIHDLFGEPRVSLRNVMAQLI